MLFLLFFSTQILISFLPFPGGNGCCAIPIAICSIFVAPLSSLTLVFFSLSSAVVVLCYEIHRIYSMKIRIFVVFAAIPSLFLHFPSYSLSVFLCVCSCWLSLKSTDKMVWFRARFQQRITVYTHIHIKKYAYSMWQFG